ncbi:caspase family protein [Nostoc sphaeroides CHAB 2801]|uniref:nSTAND1 domain-containing NTPase n=1 Tax=Nostoc sphaeroides TaxID=446679 RepID=UPI000E534E1F|nr:caspase family protein [Nostoc sphaeroides]MCC5627699.1 caspase family protein [Nostoc sphaeroides CHAB 2801]
MARYALVIGIAEYISPSLPRLSKTINDAEAIARLLEQYGDFQSVQRLPQRWNKDKNGYEMAASKVTGAQLGQDLRTFLLEQAANNEALIYFSGHGFTISDSLGQQKGYLATSDSQIEVAGNQIVEQKYGIPLDSLNELIRDSQLSSLVMLLDCCHSGYFLERQLIERTLNTFSSQKDYYLITACRGFERAGVIKSEEYSIFTGAVVKGLAIENASSNSRRISGDRLFDFISNELKGSVQEPIRMGWGRSITLVTYPQLDIPTGKKIAFNKKNPYRGLYAFELEQAQYFCGRDEAVRTLVSRLAESRFLAVIGYSGSGKSSLVKAGLLPQLKGDRLPGSSQWAIASFTPGEHPLGKLVDILTRQQQQNQPHLLFIDQFEEVFTLCQDDEERKAFIRLIAQEVKKGEGETRIILTIRGDFLNRCADYLEIITLINSIPPTSFIVTPMSFTELEEAIEKPAKLHGVTFEHGLVSQISADVINRPGALPILQYALKELWRVCIEEPESPEPLLTRKGYEEIGGVKGALDKRATILYESLTTIDQAFARCLFMELVQLGEAGEVTRRRASWDRLDAISDSPQQLQRVVGLLAGSQQRLIITDEKTVEVAHEALLSEWKLLNTWIAENLENIRLSRSLEEDCYEWQQRFNKADDALLAGAKLARFSEWANKTQRKLTPLETEFLRKSLERRDREIQAQLEQERQLRELAESRQKEAEARAIAEIEKAIAAEDKAKAEAARAKEAEASAKYQKQRTRLAIASAYGLTLLAIFTIGFGIRAEQNKNKAIQALISEPLQLLETNNQLEAMIASIKALEDLRDIGAENNNAVDQLKANVIDLVRESNRFQGHEDAVNSISFSPDGKTIASGSWDKTIKLWNIESGESQTLSGHTDKVWRVRYSPTNGNMIASASTDKTVRLWNAKSGEFLGELEGNTDIIIDLSFSPDSKKIATASFNGTIKIWDTTTKKELEILENPQGRNGSYSVDFHPNGAKLAVVGYQDGSVKVWDLNTKTPKIIGHRKISATFVRFSHDGRLLASSSGDGIITLWKDDQFLTTIKADKKEIYGLTFSPNDQMLTSVGEDGTIKLWQIDGTLSKPLVILRGHLGGVYDVSFNPKQESNLVIASAGEDKSIKLWKIIGKHNNINYSDYNKIYELQKYSCNYIWDFLYKNRKSNFKMAYNICKNLHQKQNF